jgi:hypothetical protein
MTRTAEIDRTTTPSGREVRKRHVFYFSGFDPRGASHYHTLYGAEAKVQAATNGLELEIGKRRRVGKLANAWQISITGGGTETEYEFLRWDDIIRQHWPKNELELLKSAVPVYWVFFKANLIGRLLKIAWPSALTVTYPIVAFLGVLILGVVFALALTVFPSAFGFPWWAGILPGAAALVGSLFLSRWLDERFRSYWLLRTYGLMQPWAYGKIPDLDDRIRDFALYMVERIRASDADEVLLVGHSVGTILTIPLVAEMLRLDPELGQRGPAFALVSLGNCIPLVSLLPGSDKLRADLKTVATAPGILWFDFSARRDGASLTKVDPLAVSGVARPAGIPVRPVQFPVRIVQMFPPETYAILKKDVFRVHFQYVMASELLTDYDFFAMTAGSMSLARRYPESAITTVS